MITEASSSTRERSLRAALEVVRDEGLDQLTTRAIARRSGLTQPAIYRHFSGVEELIRETLALIRDHFLDRMTEAESSGTDRSAREGLFALLDVFRKFAVDEPHLYDALFLQFGDGALMPAPAENQRGQNIFSRLVERVRECGAEGTIRASAPVASALSLIAHMQGMILMYRQGRFGSVERFSEMYRQSLEDHLRGLADGPE